MSWRIALWMAVACGSCALAADPASRPAQAAPELRVAQSALLQVDATPTGDTVVLHIRRAADQKPVSSDDVTITVDGKPASVMRGSDGSYLLSAADLRGKGPHTLELIVGHDGIRELLSGKVVVPESGRSGGLFGGEHRQIGWWILNIAVVLVAAIALSRRKKPPPE